MLWWIDSSITNKLLLYYFSFHELQQISGLTEVIKLCLLGSLAIKYWAIHLVGWMPSGSSDPGDITVAPPLICEYHVSGAPSYVSETPTFNLSPSKKGKKRAPTSLIVSSVMRSKGKEFIRIGNNQKKLKLGVGLRTTIIHKNTNKKISPKKM